MTIFFILTILEIKKKTKKHYTVHKGKRRLCVKGLRRYLDKILNQDERDRFFNVTLPFIQECAINLKYVCTCISFEYPCTKKTKKTT